MVALRIIYGLYFFVPGLLKILYHSSFLGALENISFFSETISFLLSIFIPCFELFLGSLILLNFKIKFNVALGNFTLIVFTAFLFFNLITGNIKNCNCFGAEFLNKIDAFSILRNLIFITIGFFLQLELKSISLKTIKFTNQKFNSIKKDANIALIMFLSFSLFFTTLSSRKTNFNIQGKNNPEIFLSKYDVIEPFFVNDKNYNKKLLVFENRITILIVTSSSCNLCSENKLYIKEVVKNTRNFQDVKVIGLSLDTNHSTNSLSEIPFDDVCFVIDPQIVKDQKLNIVPQLLIINQNKVVKTFVGRISTDDFEEINLLINNL